MENPESDAFVFFGATGDLAVEQIFPALQAMIRRGHFDMPIIGVARSAKDLDGLRARAHESIEKHGSLDPRAFATLSAKLQYVLTRDDGRESRSISELGSKCLSRRPKYLLNSGALRTPYSTLLRRARRIIFGFV